MATSWLTLQKGFSSSFASSARSYIVFNKNALAIRKHSNDLHKNITLWKKKLNTLHFRLWGMTWQPKTLGNSYLSLSLSLSTAPPPSLHCWSEPQNFFPRVIVQLKFLRGMKEKYYQCREQGDERRGQKFILPFISSRYLFLTGAGYFQLVLSGQANASRDFLKTCLYIRMNADQHAG